MDGDGEGSAWGTLITTAVLVAVVVGAMVYFWAPQNDREGAFVAEVRPTVTPTSTRPTLGPATPEPTHDPRTPRPSIEVHPVTPRSTIDWDARNATATPGPAGAIAVGRFLLVAPGDEERACGATVRAEWVATSSSVRESEAIDELTEHALAVKPEGLAAGWVLERAVAVRSTMGASGEVEGTFVLLYVDGGETLTVIRQAAADPCRVAFARTENVAEPRTATLVEVAGMQVGLVPEDPVSVSWSRGGVRTIVEGKGVGAGDVIAAAEAVLRGLE
ncbi:MAG: hypothetical protein ACSLFM_09135 [Tepidiformaceae bacterium]